MQQHEMPNDAYQMPHDDAAEGNDKGIKDD